MPGSQSSVAHFCASRAIQTKKCGQQRDGGEVVCFRPGGPTRRDCRLRLRLAPKLLPGWADHDEMEMLFPEVASSELPGNILAHFVEGEHVWPAISIAGDRIFCNFSIEHTIGYVLSESYIAPPSALQKMIAKLPSTYQRVPPAWRSMVLGLLIRRRLRSDNPLSFPRWPGEDAADILRYILLSCLKLADPGTPDPPAFWPQGKKYAVVLTHDVDTPWCLEGENVLADIEDRLGLRSAWFVVCRHTERPLAAESLRRLANTGHEIGCHGWEHSPGMATLPAAKLTSMLGRCARALDSFGPDLGFRSPFLARGRALYESLAPLFFYDASAPDSERYVSSFQNGCGTVLPFLDGNLVRLPLTMPQDALLLGIGYDTAAILRAWTEKMEWIKRRGGLVVVSTHPEPQFGASPAVRTAYAALASSISVDADAWLTTPREVARWWLQRCRNAAEGW